MYDGETIINKIVIAIKNWPDILPSLSDQSNYINDTHIRELPVNFPDNRQSLLPKMFEGICLGTCLS